MNIAKNMEGIFIVAIALVSGMSFANASAPAAQAVHTVQAAKASTTAQPQADANMTVVYATAKRLTAAEKAALGN